MGIVIKQSFRNTLILFLGFAIGGINVLFLYTHFLHEDYFGLITFLLSTANILLPIIVFGMHHTVIKFFSAYKTKLEQDGFLISTLILPLIVIIPLGFIGVYFYEIIANWLSKENSIIKSYTHLIFITAIFMGYFEVFYAWSKVKFQSVFGNFVKEIFARVCVSVLLFAVYFQWISNEQFIYAVVIVYGARAFIMKLYAFYLCKPKVIFKIPKNINEILSFSAYMIIAGSAGGILLEIDKFMIPQMEQIAQVAYYSVGVYIASVIGIPNRAMQQITSPITAKEMNENNISAVETLYKQTSLNLLIIGGAFFLLINLNINDLYLLIDKPQFAEGVLIVLIVSLAKLVDLGLGTGNAILVNSKYYKIFFYLSLAMAVSVIFLNKWFIGLIGINGAAMATFIVVFIYGFVKILYIKYKLKIQPFSFETLKLLVLLIGVFALFYNLEIKWHPLVNILVKSFLITIVYVLFLKLMNISHELNAFLSKIRKKK